MDIVSPPAGNGGLPFANPGVLQGCFSQGFAVSGSDPDLVFGKGVFHSQRLLEKDYRLGPRDVVSNPKSVITIQCGIVYVHPT